MRIIRWRDLKTRVPLSRTTIWRLEKAGAFPTRVKIGKNSVGWLESEVDRWVDALARTSGVGDQTGAGTVDHNVLER